MSVIRVHRTVGVRVGSGPGAVQVGGGAPVVVQSMTSTDTADAAGTAAQCVELAEAGSELVRITVNIPEAAAAVPEIRHRCATPAVDVPLIGDFHYNGHLLLTRDPGLRRRARQVPDQSRQRRHRRAARRAVHDHLPGRARPRQAGAHRRQRRLAQPGAGHAPDAGEHRPRPRPHLGRDHQRVHGALGARVDRAGARRRPAAGSDHHLVQGLAAAAPDRASTASWRGRPPAAAPRADRGRHGHQGPGLVVVGDGRPAQRRHRRHDPRLAHARARRRSARGGLRRRASCCSRSACAASRRASPRARAAAAPPAPPSRSSPNASRATSASRCRPGRRATTASRR